VSDLSDFFQSISVAKRQQKEELESILGSSFLDDLCETVIVDLKTTKKKEKEQKEKLEVFEHLVEEIVEKISDDQEEELIVEELEEEPELVEQSLGLLAEPSEVKQQKDPLTPLNQNFATLEDLNKHYNLLVNRIQQQLSTLGGGGETQLRYLDDVVGIATNSGAYNGKYLQWNSTTNRAEFTDPSDSENTTVVFVTGITTYYQATNTDDYIGVNANVPVEIRLPSSPIIGKKITVKDEGNKISTYNITVTVGAGVSVENDNSVVMKINHQSFTYFYNGSNWFLV
jgi:hypothetical protein